eukprot:jgi/Botrbrau1/13210/Bobra.9_1s0002.2
MNNHCDEWSSTWEGTEELVWDAAAAKLKSQEHGPKQEEHFASNTLPQHGEGDRWQRVADWAGKDSAQAVWNEIDKEGLPPRRVNPMALRTTQSPMVALRREVEEVKAELAAVNHAAEEAVRQLAAESSARHSAETAAALALEAARQLEARSSSQMALAEARAQTAEQATCALMEQHRKELDDLRQAHAAELASVADHHHKEVEAVTEATARQVRTTEEAAATAMREAESRHSALVERLAAASQRASADLLAEQQRVAAFKARMEEEVQKAAAGVAASFEVQQLQAALEKSREALRAEKKRNAKIIADLEAASEREMAERKRERAEGALKLQVTLP